MKGITYTKDDITRRTAQDLNIPVKHTKFVIEGLFSTMTKMITEPKSHIRIELRDFGVFELKPTKAKPRARNPKTNEEYFIPPRRKIHFKPGKGIRQIIQKKWLEKI